MNQIHSYSPHFHPRVGDTVLFRENSPFLTDHVTGYHIQKIVNGYRIIIVRPVSSDISTTSVEVSTSTYTLSHPGTTVQTTFIFGNVLMSSISIAEAGGDPYIYPVVGTPMMKVDNRAAIYRLYQDEEFVLNGEVCQATESMVFNVRGQFPMDLAIQPIRDGYFFRNLRICHIQDPSIWTAVDLETKKVHTSNGYHGIIVGSPRLSTDSVAYDSINNAYTTSRVVIDISSGSTRLKISFSKNRQVRNGLRLVQHDALTWDGLLAYNYRPKLMIVPTLSYVRPIRFPRNKKGRLYRRKGLMSHGETNIHVTQIITS